MKNRISAGISEIVSQEFRRKCKTFLDSELPLVSVSQSCHTAALAMKWLNGFFVHKDVQTQNLKS